MSAQGGCSALHRRASVSFYHAFESPGFRGADGVSSPAWVTAELRCHVDFKSAKQPDAAAASAESLSIGIDVEVRRVRLHSKATAVACKAGCCSGGSESAHTHNAR